VYVAPDVLVVLSILQKITWESLRVFSVYIPASSVVCVQHTPSSKRNLSSKILHKSLPTYFLTLTKQPSKNNLRHLKESFFVRLVNSEMVSMSMPFLNNF